MGAAAMRTRVYEGGHSLRRPGGIAATDLPERVPAALEACLSSTHRQRIAPQQLRLRRLPLHAPTGYGRPHVGNALPSVGAGASPCGGRHASMSGIAQHRVVPAPSPTPGWAVSLSGMAQLPVGDAPAPTADNASPCGGRPIPLSVMTHSLVGDDSSPCR